MSREFGNKLHNSRKHNPNHERSILLFNIIILCLITLAAIAAAAFFYLEMQSARVAYRDMNDRLNGTPAQDKDLFTAQELEAQRENARILGEETGERDVKSIIQSALASGRSTLSMLRELFPEDVVVSNEGRYYFYPVSSEVAENTFGTDDFALNGEGLLTYQGDDQGLRLTQGILVNENSGEIDWEDAAADHVDAVMVYVGGRDADGELTEDAAFKENIQGASAAGLSVGVYYSLMARTTQEAQEDAEWLVELLEPYAEQIDGYAMVMIRVPEDGDRTQSISRTIWMDNILVVSNTLKLAGYRPMLFGNLTAIMMQTEPQALAGLTRGISNVGTDLYFPYTFDLWRYASDAVVDGITEPVSRCVILTHETES